MNQLSDVQLQVVKNLTSKILNTSFQKLVQNDQTIVSENYVPNVWEKKWYVDDVIEGYDKGYCCWRNAITSVNDFLDSYGDQVYSYAQQITRLKSYLKLSWTDIIDKGLQDQWIDKYYNVISGYSETDKSGDTPVVRQYYSKMFDFGNSTVGVPNDDKIEVYVSLVGNNKAYLSDDSSWQNIVLSDDAAYQEYIQTMIRQIMSDHVQNYHFSGLLTDEDSVDKYLMRSSLSNFNVENVVMNRVNSLTKYINSDGFDYIIQFAKKEDDYSIGGKNYKLYRWFRQWYSGYLEHGGIIPSLSSRTSNLSDYYISVDLNWYNGEIYSNSYNYPTISSSFYGDINGSLYYSGDYDSEVKENYISEDQKLNQTLRYSIDVCPVSFNVSSDTYSGKMCDFNILSANGSGYGEALANQMNSFTTIEIHHIKNTSFCFTKNNTDNLKNNDKIQFYSYYTSGYSLLNMQSFVVTGVSSVYRYTGSEIIPEICVKGTRELVEGVDYTVKLKDNISPGIATLGIYGEYPFSGVVTKTFKISKMLTDFYVKIISQENIKYDPSETISVPTFIVTNDVDDLRSGVDYNPTYVGSNSKPGIKSIVINGIGDYFASPQLTKSYTVYVDIDETTVSLEKTEFEYTGSEIQPEVQVKIGEVIIGKKYDGYQTYSVRYMNNIKLGDGSVIVDGSYSGTKTIPFQIVASNLSGVIVNGIPSKITYDTLEHKAQPSSIVTKSGITLTKDIDYKLEYPSSDYINAGEKEVDVIGINNYTGTKIVKYEIIKVSVDDLTISSVGDPST